MAKITLYVPDEEQHLIEKAKLIATVLHDSLSNLVVCFLEDYVKSHTQVLKAIEKLQAKVRKGR